MMYSCLRLIKRWTLFIHFISCLHFILYAFICSYMDCHATFIRSRGSLENHTRFQTIMVKIISVF